MLIDMPMIDHRLANGVHSKHTLILLELPDSVVLIYETDLRNWLVKRQQTPTIERIGRYEVRHTVNGVVDARRAYRTMRYRVRYHHVMTLPELAVMQFRLWGHEPSTSKGVKFNTMFPEHIGHMSDVDIKRHRKAQLIDHFERMSKDDLKRNCFNKYHANGRRLWNGANPVPSKPEMLLMLYEWSERNN